MRIPCIETGVVSAPFVYTYANYVVPGSQSRGWSEV